VCDLETSRIGAPYIYIYIYIYDISSLRVKQYLIQHIAQSIINNHLSLMFHLYVSDICLPDDDFVEVETCGET